MTASWHRPIILAAQKAEAGGCKFKATLGYIGTLPRNRRVLRTLGSPVVGFLLNDSRRGKMAPWINYKPGNLSLIVGFHGGILIK